jgi:hypothetical protein
MSLATISQLSTELLGLVQDTETFKKRGFSIFDLDDFEELTKIGASFPLVGVMYEGSQTQERITNTPSGGSVRKNTLDIAFSVVIAMEYRAAGGEDTKVYAMDLLEETRSKVMGYKGVNSRPWILISEVPIDSDIEGIIFYGQLWKTIIPILGNFKQP